MNSVLDAAYGYSSEHYFVIPIPGGRKGPVLPEWQKLRLRADDMPKYFRDGGNIGLLTCAGLVDIDLDSEEARLLAPYFLPTTDRVSGRASSPQSHWFYQCDPVPDPHRYSGPGGALYVEMRSNGQQTLVPPSVHPCGEAVVWARSGKPADVHGGVLQNAVGKLAAAALLATCWQKRGIRHHLALALAGAFAHSGWAEEDAIEFISSLCAGSGDPEHDDRVRAAKTTFSAFSGGEPVTGIPTLSSILDRQVVSLFVEWTKLRPASVSRYPLTDLGNSERFVQHYGADVRYSHLWKSWVHYDGRRWSRDESGTIETYAKRTVRLILREAADEPDDAQRKKIVSWSFSSESASHIGAMAKLAESSLPVAVNAFDADPWLLNAQNGTADLRTGTVHPHDRNDYMMKLAGANADPMAHAPIWEAFLDRIMGGNKHLISFLQRVAGYALTGNVSEECLFFLHGAGQNGKSKFLGGIAAAMGDYAISAMPDLLMAKPAGGNHPTELADLFGARFVSTIEHDDGTRFAESLLKLLTGGDTIRTRRLYENSWQFTPTHKFFLASNHKPVVRGRDLGIWRRIYLIPFTVTIPPAERDGHLAEKLAAERDGILAWMLDGCLAWQQLGLQPPTEVLSATEAYKNEMDTLGGFFEDCCVFAPAAMVPSSALYAAYLSWAKSGGEKEISQTMLGRRLSERGLEHARTKAGVYWQGIGLSAS